MRERLVWRVSRFGLTAISGIRSSTPERGEEQWGATSSGLGQHRVERDGRRTATPRAAGPRRGVRAAPVFTSRPASTTDNPVWPEAYPWSPV